VTAEGCPVHCVLWCAWTGTGSAVAVSNVAISVDFDLLLDFYWWAAIAGIHSLKLNEKLQWQAASHAPNSPSPIPLLSLFKVRNRVAAIAGTFKLSRTTPAAALATTPQCPMNYPKLTLVDNKMSLLCLLFLVS
jgi:hypothetical protein